MQNKFINRVPLFSGSVVIFWGWQSHLLFLAIPMAIILESVPWISWRLVLSDKEFHRIINLTSLFATLTFFILFIRQSIYGFTTFITWLPLFFFPILVAQIYSEEGTVRISSLFFSLQRIEDKQGIFIPARIDLTYPYMMGCLISASTHRSEWFFPLVCLFVAIGLWTTRPQRYPVFVWAILLSFTWGTAYVSHLGLYTLQTYVEGKLLEWFENFLWSERDPYRQNTSIGDIRKLKQSDEIILRVQSSVPLKLREASYNSYYRSTWRAKRVDFTPVSPQENGTTWSLIPSPLSVKHTAQVQVSAYLKHGQGILPLPHGTYQITQLPATGVQNNHFGAVKVEQSLGLVHYVAHFNENTSFDAPPTDQDLSLLLEDQVLFKKLATTLNLYGYPPQQILDKIANFFNRHFHYSLYPPSPQDEVLKVRKMEWPLERFLYHTKAGHCEYFATATVLLLRTVGIPARYVAGYAVEEFSDLENAYIVRQRHAHAWSLAYLEGRWQEFDTTPANWLELEAETVSSWQMFDDLGAWLSYQFSRWYWQEHSIDSYYWLLWALLPLTLLLAWRLYRPEKIKRFQKGKINDRTTDHLENQFPFYHIVQYLSTIGYHPLPGEPLAIWLNRLSHLPDQEKIQTMLNLHLRCRFDPIGISIQERAQLTDLVNAWLHSITISKGNQREFD